MAASMSSASKRRLPRSARRRRTRRREHSMRKRRAVDRGPEADTNEGEALSPGRNDGRFHVLVPTVGDTPASATRHLCRASSPRSRFDGDRHGEVVGQHLGHGSQSRAAKCAGSAHLLGLPRFPAAAPAGCSWSNLASAASRSVSSNTSLRLISSPSTVRTAIPRHSASKPSCEVSWAA